MWMYVFCVLGKILSPHCWNMNVRFKCLLSSKKKGFVEKKDFIFKETSVWFLLSAKSNLFFSQHTVERKFTGKKNAEV